MCRTISMHMPLTATSNNYNSVAVVVFHYFGFACQKCLWPDQAKCFLTDSPNKCHAARIPSQFVAENVFLYNGAVLSEDHVQQLLSHCFRQICHVQICLLEIVARRSRQRNLQRGGLQISRSSLYHMRTGL